MSRVYIDMPNKFIYSTEIPTRKNDMYLDLHVTFDAMASFVMEAYHRFLVDNGYILTHIEDTPIIMSNFTIDYKSEARYPDVLRFEVAVANFTSTAFDIFIRISRNEGKEDVAHVRVCDVFFDYQNKKTLSIPAKFREKFEPKE
ncbi:MAG: thioesterase family protein [Leptospiraceae bacterium]|nr:thioesterase family protein [Leptospiraceae bacterium]MCP5502994.1 thioesterase family protein [Leptospiraceae bacterium]